MKLVALLFMALSLSAAVWDGTKGNITITTEEISAYTAITVKSADPTVTAALVSIRYLTPGSSFSKESQELVRFSELSSPPKAIFVVHVSQIIGIVVREYRDGEVREFGPITNKQ